MKNLKALPKDSPPLFNWLPCDHCHSVFLGRQSTCMTCRTALRQGIVKIVHIEKNEVIRTITREEVIKLRKKLESTKKEANKGSSRKLETAPALKAQSGEMTFNINKELGSKEIQSTLKKVAAFLNVVGEGKYHVHLSISRLEVKSDGS